MDLSSYLLKPVQRMGKYALILKQVLKECPETSADYQDLLAAEEMIRFCLQHGNDLLAMDALQVVVRSHFCHQSFHKTNMLAASLFHF